jgi:mitochondrial-processing peptidase subunit alpha
MLSKVSNIAFKKLTEKVQNSFGLKNTIYNLLYKDNTTDPNFIASRFDPRRPLEGHTGTTRAEGENRVEISQLKNGITVLSESSAFPSNAHFGILLDVGTRDETTETSGALLSIKNTYYKTIINTNETINYGVIQMSGGNLNVEYDQESTYFSAKSLSQDGVDVFNVLADCALEPRSVVAAQVGVE